MLIPFDGFGELQRVLGKGKLKQFFFGPRSLQNQSISESASSAKSGRAISRQDSL
jgi:hypothetical protein